MAEARSLGGHEITVPPDGMDVTIGASVDISAIGGYPIRVIKAQASGTLKLRTRNSGSTFRTITVTAGDEITMEVTEIGNTGDGSSAIAITVYK